MLGKLHKVNIKKDILVLVPKKNSSLKFNQMEIIYNQEKFIYRSFDDNKAILKKKPQNVPENILLSSGDIVLMQTAKKNVSNTEVNDLELVRLLMEFTTQRTYITIILLRMSLKKTATEKISLVTFVADKVKHLEHQKYL